jgi:hypothetical protein
MSLLNGGETSPPFGKGNSECRNLPGSKSPQNCDLKVISAIERCRTAALGGHVARCEDCPHTVIAYNSCVITIVRSVRARPPRNGH